MYLWLLATLQTETQQRCLAVERSTAVVRTQSGSAQSDTPPARFVCNNFVIYEPKCIAKSFLGLPFRYSVYLNGKPI